MTAWHSNPLALNVRGIQSFPAWLGRGLASFQNVADWKEHIEGGKR